MWPFKKKDDGTEALTEVLRDVLASNVSIKSRLKAYERDRLALADELAVVRGSVARNDKSADEEFGRANSRVKAIEDYMAQWTSFQVETRTACGVLRTAHKDLKTELNEFKVLALKKIIELQEQLAAFGDLEGQIAVIKQVTIGDLIDGGSIETDDEFADSELEFLRDLQQAYKNYSELEVTIGLGRAHRVREVPCQIDFTSSGQPIKELDAKYCLRLDGRIGYSNDVDFESQQNEGDE